MDFNNYANHILTMEEAEEGSRRFAKKNKNRSVFRTLKGTW